MVTISIDAATYTRARTGADDETVDAAHVERFLSAASFFDGLVDTPEVHTQDADGTITVTQRTPEGGTQVTTFTPVDDDASPCCIGYVTSGGDDRCHVPGCPDA